MLNFEFFKALLQKMNVFEQVLKPKDRNPWQRSMSKNRRYMKADSRRVRAHKRARWEMAKLSRRMNRR